MKNLLLALLLQAPLFLPLWAEDEMRTVPVTSALTPHVAYHLEREDNALLISIDVDELEASQGAPKLELGIAGDQALRLTNAEAQQTKTGATHRYRWKIPAARLSRTGSIPETVQMAFCVEWGTTTKGVPRLRNRFLHVDTGAVHRKLSASPEDWYPLHLPTFARDQDDRRNQIAFPFSQPLDGKVTVAIDDAKGRRVRNLLAAEPLQKGAHRLVWDGVDDWGKTVPPGEYHWRAISHPGLSPVFEMKFVDGAGSNHGTFQSVAYNGASLFAAASVAEGGFELVELDPKDGGLRRGLRLPHGHGLAYVAIAADQEHVYLLHEGRSWTDKVDETKPDWKMTYRVTLARVSLENEQIIEYPGKLRYLPLLTYEVGPGVTSPRTNQGLRAGGMALHKGQLFVGDRDANELLVVDKDQGTILRRIPFPAPQAFASAKGVLYGISGSDVVQIDPENGKVAKLFTAKGEPRFLTIGEDGRLFVSDRMNHQVHIYSPNGKLERSIGKEGGLVAGKYDPLALENPNGVVIAGDRIWVTEMDRWRPKRLAAYDTTSGAMLQERFGPPNYGSAGGGFDPLDHERWIGQDTFFQLDFAKKTAEPQSVFDSLATNRLFTTRRHQFWRQDGRTFLISSGKATFIQEVLPNSTVKPLAMISSAHQFCFSYSWMPPQVFLNAFQKAYPDVEIPRRMQGGKERINIPHGYGVMWVDLNGDGVFQEEEFNFSTDATQFAGSGWSHDFHDLVLRVPAVIDKQPLLVALKPEGFYDNGVPRYPSLNEALKTAVPIDMPPKSGFETAVDRFGNLVALSTPDMAAFSPDGTKLWTYPNLYSNVHGSHRAPLPVPGQLQGALFFSGMAPLDEKSDVFFLNGNHGQGFIMTSDGLYLDAVFPDVRTMTNPFAGEIGILGGECFGGTFGRSEKNGAFYFQGGGLSYRIYEIKGLQETQRAEGSLVVSAAQAQAAERRLSQKISEETTHREATIPRLNSPELKSLKPIVQWSKDKHYPVSLQAWRDADRLHLIYTVRDDSPWVNHGNDWQSLFKTGDGVDLQLGTDPMARPQRTGAAPGDLRLFIAPMGEENVAVLYRHRVPHADPEEGVEFQSPWRSEKVDQVVRLSDVSIKVERRNQQYRLHASIPLQTLGLDPDASLSLRGDFGVIYGDKEGTVNLLRNYWSNQATGLVNDVPGEIMLNPALWGTLHFPAALSTP